MGIHRIIDGGVLVIENDDGALTRRSETPRGNKRLVIGTSGGDRKRLEAAVVEIRVERLEPLVAGCAGFFCVVEHDQRVRTTPLRCGRCRAVPSSGR